MSRRPEFRPRRTLQLRAWFSRACRLSILLLLAGCTVAPGVRSPAAPPPPPPTAVEATPSADQRAAARLAEGLAAVAAAPGDPLAVRAAFDAFSIGLLLTPADSALRAELARRQAAAALLLDAVREPNEAPQFCHEARAIWPDATAPFAVCAPPEHAATIPVAPTVAPARAQTSAPSHRPAPPPSRPAPPRFAVIERKSFEGAAPSGQYSSCIDIQIRGRNGPVGGAVIGINNGEHSYQNQTNADGYTGRCGLGASTWSVVLFWTPPDQTIAGAATTVWVNGAAEQRAAVVFQEE